MTANAPLFLLVENDANDAFFFKRAVKKAEVNHAVQVACDGEQAIAYLFGEGKFADRREYPLPCLIVLDLNMPVKDGFEVLEWLRQTPPFDTLPAVVLTSSQAEQDRKQACDLGAKAYYVKPSDPVRLIELVKAMVAFCLDSSAAP